MSDPNPEIASPPSLRKRIDPAWPEDLACCCLARLDIPAHRRHKPIRRTKKKRCNLQKSRHLRSTDVTNRGRISQIHGDVLGFKLPARRWLPRLPAALLGAAKCTSQRVCTPLIGQKQPHAAFPNRSNSTNFSHTSLYLQSILEDRPGAARATPIWLNRIRAFDPRRERQLCKQPSRLKRRRGLFPSASSCF